MQRRKQFISKTNKGRFGREERRKLDYKTYNDRKMKIEFISTLLYRRVLSVPKPYLSHDENGDLIFHSQRVGEADATLNTFLFGSHKTIGLYKQDKCDVAIEELDIETENLIKSKIQGLKSMGSLVYMAMLLCDSDVFGPSLGNALVVDNEVYKIDASDVAILLGKDDRSEHFDYWKRYFDKNLHSLVDKGNFEIQLLMPFFNFIFKNLSPKQHAEGLAAIQTFLRQPQLDNDLKWLASVLELDPSFVESTSKTLTARGTKILETLGPRNTKELPKVELNDIWQEIVFRPTSDFVDTNKYIPIGNAQPAVTEKHGTLPLEETRKFLKSISEELKTLIDELNTKKSNFEESKSNKKAIIEATVADLKRLKLAIDHTGQRNKIRSVDLANIYQQYTKIMMNRLDALNKDQSEAGAYQYARRKFTDIGKQFASLLTRENPAYSTISQIEEKDQVLHNKFLNFFRERNITLPTSETEKHFLRKPNKS